MKSTNLSGALALVLLAGCASNDSAVRAVSADHLDTELRNELFSAVRSLEGTWQSDMGESSFAVTSGGSVIRETMFPGQDQEMTNMYALDGNALEMTHYCGAGNQPHMSATSVVDNRIVFEATGVSDLKDTDETYMGAMTLVLVDEDHFEEHWIGMTPSGEIAEEHAMVMEFRRVQ